MECTSKRVIKEGTRLIMKREEVFNYIKENYDIMPEYLWNSTPDAAIFRHKSNNKWFSLIMNVNGEEYLNVKTDPNYSEFLRNAYEYIMPAYHMSKEHWNTIIISKGVDKKLVWELIQGSYQLTSSKMKTIKH